VNCYLACAAILACGYRGIEKKLPLPAFVDPAICPSLPRSLLEATDVMDHKDSIARQVLGNEFVDHYVATRRHELRLWQTTVTTWEVKRYMETV
jgi:glutamine synthetase